VKPETKFKIKVAGIFDKIPCFWYVKIQQVSINGTPDFLICHWGRFVAVELKKSDQEEPSRLQKYELGKILEAKGISIVMSPEDYKEIIKKEFNHIVK